MKSQLRIAFPLALVLALGCGLGGTPARADDLPEDWVAQCSGQVLGLRALSSAMVKRSAQDLQEIASSATTVLRQMTEERLVRIVAKNLGIVATDADVDARARTIDTEVRARTGGAKTLRDVVYKDMHSTLPEFRAGLRHVIRKERIAGHERFLGSSLPKEENRRLAQVQVVVTQLLQHAKIEYGIPTALQAQPTDLGTDGVFRITGFLPDGGPGTMDAKWTVVAGPPEVVTRAELGMQLALRLPIEDVRHVVDLECKSILTKESALSEADMDAAIQQQTESWNRQRESMSQEAWRTVPYSERVKALYRLSLDELRRDLFFRGLFGLVRRFQAGVQPIEIQAEYESKKSSTYGPAIRVVDIGIAFAQKNTLVASAGQRERKDALKAANEILVQKESGVPFDQISRQVNDKKDRSFVANQRKIRNTDDDHLLWERAFAMKDGEVQVVETLSAVHVLKREAFVPAPTFEEARPFILEGISWKRAEAWLESRLGDSSVVKVRWPLPEPVWEKALEEK